MIYASLWPDPADLLCPQAFRDAAAERLRAFARRMDPEKITGESKQLQQPASPESPGTWESPLGPAVELDPADEAHQNVLHFGLLHFIADSAI